MKREFLESLGIDKENIDKIMDKHGEVIETNKTKISGLEKERDDFKNTVETLSKSVEDLKQVDPTKIQEELDKIKKEKEELDIKYAEETKALLFNNALDLAIVNSKTIDPVALKAHIKVDNLKYDAENNKLIGFDDQLKTIQESQNYLFETEPNATGDSHTKLPGDDQNGFNFGFTPLREMPNKNRGE